MRLTAQELRDYLNRNNLTQCGFADFMGLSKKTVERWIQNRQHTPKWLRHIVDYVPISAMPDAQHKYKRYNDPESDLKHLQNMAHIRPMVLKDMELVEMPLPNHPDNGSD